MAPILAKEYYRKTALRYACTLNIKHMVQTRTFRKSHPDTHYASALYRYQREFAICYRKHILYISMDDKHTIKVGEPGYPVAAAEWGKSVLVSRDKQFCVGIMISRSFHLHQV